MKKYFLSLFIMFWLFIVIGTTFSNFLKAEDLEYPIFKSCYDGDTCKFDIPDVPDVFGKNLAVRIRGIDTPEIRGKCENEKIMAKKAKEFINFLMNKATLIEVKNVERGKYFRVVADVYVDGKSIAKYMIQNDYALPYEEDIDWCKHRRIRK